MLPDVVLQSLLDPSAMRLAMGELTGPQLHLAQDAVRHALSAAGEQGWSLVPVEPDPALLMSIAIRLDHGLGVPGYYDDLKTSFEQLGQAPPMPTHGQRLEATLATARSAHAQLLSRAQPIMMPAFEELVSALQGSISAQLDALRGENALVVASAVRYGLANLSRHGYRLLPHAPTQAMLDAAALALGDTDHPQAPDATPEWVARNRHLRMVDAGRIHEEVVGLGFYRPTLSPPSGAKAPPRSPR